MKRRNRLWLIVALLAVVGLLGLAFRPRPADVDLAAVARGALCVTVDEDGKTRIRERYDVSSPLAGRLLRIELEPGDTVTRGQTLVAVLEPRDPSLLDARELASSQRESARSRRRWTERRRRWNGRDRPWSMPSASWSAQRMATEPKGKVISDEELERSRMLYRQAKASWESARFAEDMANYELELAKAALLAARGEGQGDPQHTQFEIHSPINGRVLRVFQESATVVEAGTRLLEVGDPTDLEVEVDVLSADAVQIRPGVARSWNNGVARNRWRAKCCSSNRPPSPRSRRLASRNSGSM